MKILLVENDPDDLKLGLRLLEKRGHIVLTANTANQALNILTVECGIRIAILDIFLAGTDGRKIYSIITASCPETTAIFYSHMKCDAEMLERWGVPADTPCFMKDREDQNLLDYIDSVL